MDTLKSQRDQIQAVVEIHYLGVPVVPTRHHLHQAQLPQAATQTVGGLREKLSQDETNLLELDAIVSKHHIVATKILT